MEQSSRALKATMSWMVASQMGRNCVCGQQCSAISHQALYMVLFFFFSPSTRPTIKATRIATTTKATRHMRFHPPLLAIYLLFLTSHNFSPFGPVATHGLYLGGGFS